MAIASWFSQQVGTILDVEDVIPDARYTLEVSCLRDPNAKARETAGLCKIRW